MVLRIFWNIGVGFVQRALTASTAKPGLGVLYPAVWRARSGLLDCDINMHLNNSSYLYAVELARWHFSAVTGIMAQAIKKRQLFLIASQTIRYRHPIPPFSRYHIHTQVVYWDDLWIYFLHQFKCPTTGKLYAEALCRATVKQGKSRIGGRELYLAATGFDVGAPTAMPPVVEEFLKWDIASKASMEISEKNEQDIKATDTRREGWLAKLTGSWNLPF